MPDDLKVEPKVEPKVETTDSGAELAALKAELAALKAGKPPAATEAPDLIERARRDTESKNADAGRIKRLEASIEFNMKSPDFIKTNAALLPPDVAGIFEAANKEIYSDQTEKADAIKSNLIQSFFAIQSNVDLLTHGQKAQLDEYLKLTKTGKQDRAQATFDIIFEPAFEMLRRIKRAEALNKGFSGGSDQDTQYRNRLISASNKHFGLEKK